MKEERRTARQQLEELRLAYENFMREAERAYDAYAEHFTKCEAALSKDSNSLKGFYGKTSLMLADFGTTVQSRPVGRSKNPQRTPNHSSWKKNFFCKFFRDGFLQLVFYHF